MRMNSYYHQATSFNSNDQARTTATTTNGDEALPMSNSTSSPGLQQHSSPPPPPIVYGELSILGHNGYIPNSERSGRRNKSKFLLCKRSQPNGIKKSRHYIVKQPQETKAVQDKGLHSISYTFSRSQTIIVEYKQDEATDMFQIGRSSEDPIDFVVMDTVPAGCNLIDTTGPGALHRNSSGLSKYSSSSPASHHHSRQPDNFHYPNHHNENASSSQQQQQQQLVGSVHLSGNAHRFHRHLVKVGEEMLHYGFAPQLQNHRSRLQMHSEHVSPVLIDYPPPNLSNLPPMMANHFRYQDSSLFHHSYQPGMAHSSGSQPPPPFLVAIGPNHNGNGSRDHSSSRHHHQQHGSSHHHSGGNLVCKRSHTTQSTISRFACRILVDRNPPYRARIYAAGFDSSKNIFLGEKATKWEQDNIIDGLTTNGVLLMHPKRGYFYEESKIDAITPNKRCSNNLNSDVDEMELDNGDNIDASPLSRQRDCSNNNKNNQSSEQKSQLNMSGPSESDNKNDSINRHKNSNTKQITRCLMSKQGNNDTNNNNGQNAGSNFEYGGVWREVSVDGGIYAIRESRSAVQKGKRIENETNVLQDGTLIDLCGATLLWRSLDGFKASPTKKSLEEKIDMLNASRPQCPVGLNTLVIPRKPILPNANHRSHRHYRKDNHSPKDRSDEKSGQQPYVYLKCGHVQGYHDWGATDKMNQRTCPICLSVGTVVKLSMGLEPSFYVDSGPLTHVFNPCGHMASERTVRYWSTIKIPHGTHFFHSICPFCATPLASTEPPSTKLIFQEDLD